MNLTQLRLCIETGECTSVAQVLPELRKISDLSQALRSQAGKSLLKAMEGLTKSEVWDVEFFRLTGEDSFIRQYIARGTWDWDRTPIEGCCYLLSFEQFAAEAEERLRTYLMSDPLSDPELLTVIAALGKYGSEDTDELLSLLLERWERRLAASSASKCNISKDNGSYLSLFPREAPRWKRQQVVDSINNAKSLFSERPRGNKNLRGRPFIEWDVLVQRIEWYRGFQAYRAEVGKATFADFVAKKLGNGQSAVVVRSDVESLRKWANDRLKTLGDQEPTWELVKMYVSCDGMTDDAPGIIVGYLMERKKAAPETSPE